VDNIHDFLLPQITDECDNIYTSVVIGTQEWLVENLRTCKYNNGDLIPNVQDFAQWNVLTTGGWAHFDNDPAYENPYGKLYNWHAVNDARGICPAGFHVPTLAEFTTLANHLGGAGVAGGKMKETGTAHWWSPNTGATNSSGWTALPGSNRYDDGADPDGFPWDPGIYGDYWTGTDAGFDWSEFVSFRYDNDDLDMGGIHDQKTGMAVRCLKD
jgi:uncharacterized protein (TIGR02145 family)